MDKPVFFVCAVLILSGCAAAGGKFSPDPDRITQKFFTALERNHREDAYSLFGKGLGERVSFGQFDRLFSEFKERWGRMESQETVFLPFHTRNGESNFIPLNASEDQIKRYTYEVKFENAQVNFDLTLAPQDGQYKIVWFSFWGSSVYLTPDITARIGELFNPTESSSE